MLVVSETNDNPVYYFNTRTKMVETGQISSWEDLMGPYPSREEAQKALETAKKRSETWDVEDDDWRGKA